MNYFIKNQVKLVGILFLVGISLTSCDQEEIRDAQYPEEKLYMPAAVNGLFRIDNIPVPPADVPTSGGPARFIVDSENNSFVVPLGVYRAGVKNTGAINVDISANTDTVSKLISSGELAEVQLLPSDQYSVSSSLVVHEGEDFAPFELGVNLDFLQDNPDEIFAIGIEISSDERQINSDLNTTVVVIDTKIMTPKANFTYNVDPDDWRRIDFTNTSSYSASVVWDFGDDSSSSESSPSHTYSDAGLYPVQLTAIGLDGSQSTKTFDVRVFDVESIINVAINKPVEVSGTYNDKYVGENAVDGVISNSSRWLSSQGGEHWIEIDLEQEYTIVSFKTWVGANENFGWAIKNFTFQAEIDGEWQNIVEVTGNSDPEYETMFPEVTTSKVRYFVPKYGGNLVRLYEIAVYAIPE